MIRRISVAFSLLLVLLIASAAAYAYLLGGAPGPLVFDNNNTPWLITSQINAINYNRGGLGVGFKKTYYTVNPACDAGQSYRPDYTNFVTINDSGATFDLGSCAAQVGDFFNYYVQSPTTQTITLNARVGDANDGAQWNVLIDNAVVATLPVPNTGGYQAFTTIQSASFTVSSGNHLLQLQCAVLDSGAGGCGDLVYVQGAMVSSISPPVQAQNAGLTTLLANWDFQNGQICTYDGRSPACVSVTPVSNWLDCVGNDPTKLFHSGWTGGSFSPLPCNIAVVTDPLTSTQALTVQYIPSYQSTYGQTGSNNFVAMNTEEATGPVTFTHPGGSYYIEITYRVDQALQPGFAGNTDWWEGNTATTSSSCDLDLQFGEIFTTTYQSQAGSISVCNVTPSVGYGCSSGGCSSNMPTGYATTQYHNYAAMQTTNGSNSLLRCLYLDNVLQQDGNIPGGQNLPGSCNEGFHDSSQFTAIPHVIAWAGTYFGVSGYTNYLNTVNLYTRFVHIWSCAPSHRDANNQCEGTVKTGGPQGNLWYWGPPFAQ